jgi:hypothetical protein
VIKVHKAHLAPKDHQVSLVQVVRRVILEVKENLE